MHPTLDRYSELRERAERIRAMIHRRAVVAYHQALGHHGPVPRDAHLNACIIHNSLVGFANGKPWREVDYSKMRLAKRLCERSFKPRKIADRYYQRLCQQMRAA